MISNGKIPFDMNVDVHPSGSQAYFMIKRWKKYTIFAKSGSWNRTENPNTNLYATSSVFLYDYIVVTDTWFNQNVYTASFVDDTVGSPGSEASATENLWSHSINTWRNSPNAIVNNYTMPTEFNGLRNVTQNTRIFSQVDEYFELVKGYPRNHFTHKRDLFSLYQLVTYGKQNGAVTSGSYRRNQQTIDTTVGLDGLEDGSAPVQAVQVGNLNLIQTDNVINR
jgi:hypothetical protein